VNWRILATDGFQSDFDKLTDDERAALADDLWVGSRRRWGLIKGSGDGQGP
jgi:hypothetical protein